MLCSKHIKKSLANGHCEVCLRKALSWALDLLYLYYKRLATIDGHKKVYTKIHVAGKRFARAVLEGRASHEAREEFQKAIGPDCMRCDGTGGEPRTGDSWPCSGCAGSGKAIRSKNHDRS